MNVTRKNEIPKEHKTIFMALRFAGCAFIIVGILALIFPDVLYEYTGFDGMIAKIFAAQLIVLGIFDIVWLPKILLKPTQNTQETKRDDNIN